MSLSEAFATIRDVLDSQATLPAAVASQSELRVIEARIERNLASQPQPAVQPEDLGL